MHIILTAKIYVDSLNARVFVISHLPSLICHFPPSASKGAAGGRGNGGERELCGLLLTMTILIILTTLTTGTGRGNRNTQDHDAAMLPVLLLLSGGLLRLGTLQQADDLGVFEIPGSRQGSGPTIRSLVDISSSLKQDSHYLHMTLL